MSTHQQRVDKLHRKIHKAQKRPAFDCIALLLQGGGALGAYQAGVYEALAEARLHPDWVAGISVGAINSALIAGNPPRSRVEKLRAFWEAVTAKPIWAAGRSLASVANRPRRDLRRRAADAAASTSDVSWPRRG